MTEIKQDNVSENLLFFKSTIEHKPFGLKFLQQVPDVMGSLEDSNPKKTPTAGTRATATAGNPRGDTAADAYVDF